MAVALNKLSAKAVDKLRAPGLHGDGGGLYLQVSATGARSWIYRYKVDGAVKTMGLGPLPAVSLREAREKAQGARRIRVDGLDPLTNKREQRAAQRRKAARAKTFAEVAREYIDAHKAAWRGDKTQIGWERSLFNYAAELGAVPIADVGKTHILDTLRPWWTAHPETARRLRRHLESVLAFAVAHGYRDGSNPALWRGNLQFALPALGKIERVQHHAAIPFPELPAFIAELGEETSLSARALEFCILTACRTTEVLQAAWSEIDLDAATWSISAERMKGGRAHRVPLTDAALELLHAAADHRRDGFVWPGQRQGRPLSNMAFLMLLRRMGRSGITAHGFRSAFRDWAAETTHFPNHVVEMALAHSIGNAVEAAYRRGDLFDKRRQLMAEWADHCAARR